MLNLDNPNFEKPSAILRENSRFLVEQNRFTGPKSYDGFVGGPPLAYDRERSALAVDSSDNHTLVYGATGSKKTRCVVMPTIRMLGFAGESMLINDPKGELYRTMARFLKDQDYNIVTLNFRNASVGDCWNFLEVPYRFYKEGNIDKACEFIEDVAKTITLDTESKEPFWSNAAASCLYGLILCLFRYCKKYNEPDEAVNIGNLLTLRQKMFAPRRSFSPNPNPIWEWAKEDELIAASMTGTVETASDTQKGILSTLDQALKSFVISPSLVEMLSHSTFSFDHIAQEKTAVFLLTPDEKTTYHRLVALYISQSYQQLIQLAERSGGKLPGRVNYILDEFSSLPVIGGCDFVQYLTAGRSRNLRFILCLQSKNQLVHTYKENAQTITANCTNWIYLFSRELELLKDISALCGEKKDHTPNLSVYDLQQLDKEKNQALLLSDRYKPAIVTLLDISGYSSSYTVLPIKTPTRAPRILLNFSEIEKEKKEKEEREKKEREKKERETKEKEAKEREEKEKEGSNNFELATPTAIEDIIKKDEADKKNFQEAILSAIKNLNDTLMNLGADSASKKNVNVVPSDNESEG